VFDSGIGLGKKEQEGIFDAFTQADSSTTRLYGGTGLGLSISKSLAELIGGDLSVRSEKGKGSCFTLNIEAGQIDGEEFIIDAKQFQYLVEEHKKATQVQEAPKLTGRILVAEDNPENQQLISHLLEQCGLDVTVVENGQLAVDECQKQRFDLILLDMQMPIMGGKKAANIIQKQHPQLPIVAFTANVMKHQVTEYLALGFSSVLEKPINQSHVYEVLQQHLKKTLREGRVLIVDDNQVNQMVLQRFVTKANDKLTIKLAHNGEQAINMAVSDAFDLILMDMEMPVMGGLEAIQKLRDLGLNMPIYMVSGNVDQKHKKLSVEAGANGHLAKPIEKNLLHSLINEVFQR
jgi:CheY-like chemotaxis protein